MNVDKINHKTEQNKKYQTELNKKLDEFDYLAKILNLAGNPIRLKILYLLNKEEALCVNELSSALNISISSTSQHLRKLKDSELLKCKKEKQTVFYFINPQFHHTIASLFNLIE